MIRVLSEQLSSQIAAGEVVERPSSAVKELVENALDAGADTINIDIREGGRDLIQVADNGTGITSEEIEIAFLRHSTSKISSVDDLDAIATLGFRGEALAAISAVSRLTIVSRAPGEKSGTRLVLEGGIPVGKEMVGAPQGTLIAVENLFFNVPARKKFLKSITTEKRHIDEFITRYALAYPDVRFRLSHNNRVSFQVTGNGDTRDVLLALYGAETARQLMDIVQTPQQSTESPDDKVVTRRPIDVSGFVGPPSLHWANRNHITLFVNGRWVKDKSLTYAVTQAYHTLLPKGRYPLGILFITMPYDQVDVNVHPAKTEVRFRYPNAVFGAVQRQVRETLLKHSPIPALGGWQTDDADGLDNSDWLGAPDRELSSWDDLRPQRELDLDWSKSGSRAILPTNDELEEFGPTTADETALINQGDSDKRLPIMRVVGQVGAAFIITEGPDGMYLIDQHAAHERILFERFMDQRENEGIMSQGLVAGHAVHLPPAQEDLLTEHLALLNQIGFQLEPFGPNTVMIRAVPAIAANINPEKALIAVIDDLEQGDYPLQRTLEEKVITRVCKSAAIKAGQTLSVSEMEAMVHQLEACRNPFTCPHGRPTLIHLSVKQLARQFGRT